jgi:hypothetical protein
MKKLLCFLVIFLLLPLALAACSSDGGEVPICDPEAETFTQESKEAFWAENGMWRATTLEEASEVAGFEVISFGFIPEGCCRGLNIEVEDRCIPLSEFIEDCEMPVWVTQFWWWLEYEDLEFSERPFLMLVQSPGTIATGDIATEVGGYPATIKREGSGIVVLYWEIDGMHFLMSGQINGPLTEEVLYEMAASIEMD